MREAAFEIARQSDAFAPTIAHELIEALAKPFAQLASAWKLAKLHRTLDALDDRQLADIGITRAEIYRHTGRTETVAKTISRIHADVRHAGWQCAGR